MDLQKPLEVFFRQQAPLARGDLVLVAFSSGADSTALLDALCEYAPSRGIRITAAHIDHKLDAGSDARAKAAQTFASALGIELVVERQDVPAQRRRSESLEVAARRIRYQALEEIGRRLGVRYIATAHHRDDQAETVLLRLAAGHGLSAVASVPARRGAIVRPLLAQSREDLLRYVRGRGLTWVEDPTNRDLANPRNRLRHLLIPRLAAETPDIARRLANLAEAASGANAQLSREFEERLAPCIEGTRVTVSKPTLAALPESVLPYAIVHLLRSGGGRRRPSRRALSDVQSHLTSQAPVGVDLGGGWRIEEAGNGNLRVLEVPKPTPLFSYNLTVPGEVRLDELACSIRLSAGCVEPWMFQGARLRAGFSLSLEPRERLIVRNRRPGDRVQPLGSSSRQKLKNILINHGIPKHERDRLPLLCHSESILWVPGVTIDHGARIRNGKEVWIAEIFPDE